MKNMTKPIALLCCFAFFLFSCDNAKKPGNEKNAVDEAAEATTAGDGLFHDKVPQLDFGGYEYRVIQGTYVRSGQMLFVEEEIGDVLNDAIYVRDRKIEDRFNIKFNANTVELFELYGTLSKNVKSGADAYDEYMLIDRDAYTAVGENFLYPFDKLPYIDLAQPYWCQIPNKQLTVDGKLYWGFNDNMLSFFEAAIVVYFNKKQVADLAIADFYSLVRTGNWTHEKFFEFAKAAAKDLDGDGKMTGEDNWGIASETDYLFPCFWISAGMNLVDKDSGDIPYFSVPGNQKFFDIADRVVAEFKTDGVLANAQQASNLLANYGDDFVSARISFFRDGHSLFSVGEISEMVKLRDMPDDFGILPFPKYAADQPQYYTRVCVGFPFTVPTTAANPEISGAIMEAMACEARNTIIRAYYESALKNKYSRDPDTAEMLDLIFDTRVYDLGDTIWCFPIRFDYGVIFASGKGNFASLTEKNEAKYNLTIQKSVDAILENN